MLCRRADFHFFSSLCFAHSPAAKSQAVAVDYPTISTSSACSPGIYWDAFYPHDEAASRPAGVHAEYHPATPQPSAALFDTISAPKLGRGSAYGVRVIAFLWRSIFTTLYLCVLFRLPALYFSRVARVFENAELCRRDIIRMAAARATQWEKALGGTQNHVYGYQFHEPQGNELSFPLLQFKTAWEQFVDNLLQEWKVLNVISALLTSAVLTILQIDAAAADPVARTAALLALVCTLMSLLYGCLYTVRFSSMKAMYKASEWALEAQKTTTNIFWNVWVMLAMPAIWLLWSIISFIVSIMAFVWRAGAGGEPADLVASPSQLLASRVIISVSLALGALYFVLVVRTFTRYGDRIDRRWRKNVHEQMRQERQLKAREAGFRATMIVNIYTRARTAPGPEVQGDDTEWVAGERPDDDGPA
ncbi:hypothetical protein FB107DRAFT_248013 [Schizophyllum commune]